MKSIGKVAIISLLLFAGAIFAQTDIPYMTGRITDNAEILSPETIQSLSEILKEHEIRTSNQIAVLTVSTLNGEAIEDYAVRVFEAWKLGQKEKDNGILIVVVPDDRKMRIEVGYGLEGTLPDGKAGRIIRHVMIPKFKKGDYDGGIAAGVRAVINVLEGGEMPQSELSSEPDEEKGFQFEAPDIPLIYRILFGAFIFGIIGLFTAIGIATPGVGWFLYFFLIPFWASFPIVVVGAKGALTCLILYIIGFPIAKLYLKSTGRYKKLMKVFNTRGGGSIGGFSIGSGSSGSSWTSHSSGSSGFSGGGGSSGGGGASGSW